VVTHLPVVLTHILKGRSGENRLAAWTSTTQSNCAAKVFPCSAEYDAETSHRRDIGFGTNATAAEDVASLKKSISDTTNICLMPLGNSRNPGYVITLDFIFSITVLDEARVTMDTK
jgi:hypothetical protein